jgi:DNA repair protein SbcC/Rad50
LKKKADERPQREAKIRDLKKVIEVQGLSAALEEAKKLVETLNPHIEALRSSQKETEKSVKEKETEIESIRLPSTDEIAELKAAAKDWTNLEAQESKLAEELLQLNRLPRNWRRRYPPSKTKCRLHLRVFPTG